MGLTHVQVTVRNPADLGQSWEGAFLVDTGAIDSLVPRDRLEQIGLQPVGRRIYGLADGREVEMGITVARLEFMGDVIGTTIVVGEDGTEPLLGVTALESMGIEVDPRSQQLRKLPSIRLKGAVECTQRDSKRGHLERSPARVVTPARQCDATVPGTATDTRGDSEERVPL